jgi:type 1 glutamine amidotransferase
MTNRTGPSWLMKRVSQGVCGAALCAAASVACSGSTEVVGFVANSTTTSGGSGVVAMAGNTSGGAADLAGSAGSPVVTTGGSSGGDVNSNAGSGTTSAGASNAGGAGGTGGGGGSGGATGPVNVLVFNYTSGYGHQSRETAIPVLQAAAAADTTQPAINFDIKYALTAVLPEGTSDSSQNLKPDYSAFVEGGLDKYDVVYFLNTTGSPLGADGMEKVHEQALQDYMEKTHGGFVGTHSATDTYQGNTWPWYVDDLIGANFVTHSNYPTQGSARYNDGVTAANNVILKDGAVPNPWQRAEEWYTFTRDVRQYTPSDGSGIFTALLLANDNQFPERPTAWVNQLTGGGRVFYTAFGHDVSAFKEPAFQQFFFAGIRWAAHRL